MSNDKRRRVILVTDGDLVARQAVETAAANIGGRAISASAGNPTILSGDSIIELIRTAHNDPVVVMVDDRGHEGKGKGEQALEVIAKSPDIEVLGIVAVASNGKDYSGLPVTCSVTRDGQVMDTSVDKYGNNLNDTDKISGDTLSVLKELRAPVIIGIGDPGKMDGMDDIAKGSPITTKALQEVLKRSGFVYISK